MKRLRALRVLAIAIWLPVIPAPAMGGDLICERVYTLDADFDEGVLDKVNHDAPNNDQLQLSEVQTPFPFVNIACSARGTVVRIDVNTGAITGEYYTSPNGMGRNPSRTTVDKLGNVWVANRDEASGGKGSVARIGIVVGGTRCQADGTPDANGQYLKPPFQYSTAVDRDGDGLIKTSRGLGNILPWTNAGGADTNGGVSTADDELIINYTRVAGTNTRTMAVDANNDLWTGGFGNNVHEKVSGVTGLPLPPAISFGCGGYGGLIDHNGVLWSARGGSGLLRYDPATNAGACLGTARGDYGLGLDPVTGEVWHTFLYGNMVARIDPVTLAFSIFPHGFDTAQGVAVDSSGNVWVAHSLVSPSTTVGHLRTNGTYVGNVTVPPGPTGVAVDANGKIWVACYNANKAVRIDPAAGPIGGGGFPVGAVDMTVDLGAGALPYNYSDMTGSVLGTGLAPIGTWTVVHDGGVAGTEWGTVSWTSDEPDDTGIVVEVRAADDTALLPGLPWTAVANGENFCDKGIAGRYLQIRATLSRTATAAPSPILYDLSLKCCNRPPTLECPEPATLECVDQDGAVTLTAHVEDEDGDALTVTWIVDGTTVQTDNVPAGGPPTVADVPMTQSYALGAHTVVVIVSDGEADAVKCETSVTVVDTEPPIAWCTPTTNPAGKTVPGAKASPKAGQNPDGFYELTAWDKCWPVDTLMLFVVDPVTSMVFGPFSSGDKVKLTQAPGAPPTMKPMAGVIAAHITMQGDPEVYAVDGSGNVSARCRCLVPPPPK